VTDASTSRPAPGKPPGKLSGPLRGYGILELAGLGALPCATLKLSGMGADAQVAGRT
jgi:hypothetical protein